MTEPRRGHDTFSSAMDLAINYKRWLVETFQPFIGSTLLEVGVGDGGLIDALPAHELYIGLDIDSDVLAEAKRRNPAADYVEADVADAATLKPLLSIEIDTVLCFNVIEHIADDAAAVHNLAALLRPGGHLLLLAPALQGLYTDLDRLAGHLRRYRLQGLDDLLPESMEPRLLRYFNPIGGIGWWLNRFRKTRSLEEKAVTTQVVLFDRYFLPVSRLLGPLTGTFFGQSVICASRKR